MFIKMSLAIVLATACSAVLAQTDSDIDKQLLDKCQSLAKKMNLTKKLGIRPDGMQAFVTWRAACAERPPVGQGNVTSLCQGTRVTPKGEEQIFFWQKSDHGRLNNGYFSCTD